MKYPTTKSSNEIVNANTNPENIPPLTAGTITFNTDLNGLTPKSSEAYNILGSISFIFGNTDKIIYGSIKYTCAIKIVQKPNI